MAPYNRDKQGSDSEQFRKLFIGGLTLDTTEQDLRDFYGKWGEIVDAVVMVNRQTQRSRGFGFVTYSDPEMVNTAQSNRPHKINNRVVEAKRATPREESNDKTSKQAINRLFIGGMKKELTEEMLGDYFREFGNVVKIETPKSEKGEPRGFCYITFDDYDPVDKAVLIKRHTINNITFDVKKAMSREQINDSRRGGDGGYGNYPPPKDRRGTRAPPGPPAHYYDYPRYPYPDDPYYAGGAGGGRYEPPAPYPAYDDAYGNGWSDAGGYPSTTGYGPAQTSFGSYEDQSYAGGPIRERGGYGHDIVSPPHRNGPYQVPRGPRGPPGPRR